MQTATVHSSNIVRIGHKNKVLFCLFHHGGVYSYSGVTEAQYDEFAAAPSAGIFFHREIKPKFEGVKVEGDSAEAAALRAAPQNDAHYDAKEQA